MDITGLYSPLRQKLFFVTVVVLARVKCKIGAVLFDIGFEGPVLIRS